ncbi:hypothetical protein D3C75_1183720 [compost metagenome]
MAVHKAQLLNDEILRNHNDLIRDHEGREIHDEQPVLPGELQSGERVSRQRTGDQLPQSNQNRDFQRVEVV